MLIVNCFIKNLNSAYQSDLRVLGYRSYKSWVQEVPITASEYRYICLIKMDFVPDQNIVKKKIVIHFYLFSDKGRPIISMKWKH